MSVRDQSGSEGPVSLEGDGGHAAMRPGAPPGWQPHRHVAFAPIVLVLAASAVALALGRHAQTAVLALPFLVAALSCGLLQGAVSAIIASLLAAAVFWPISSSAMAGSGGLGAALLLLLSALPSSVAAGRLRDRTARLKRRAAHAEALYEFGRRVNENLQHEEIRDILVRHASAALGADVAVLAPDAGPGLDLVARSGGADLDGTALEAALRSRREGVAVGNGAELLPALPWLFMPLPGPGGGYGVLGVRRCPGDPPLDHSERELLRALCLQAADAMQRSRSALDLQKARVTSETEKLRAALLSSISHDLRTPLAAILGSVTALRNYGSGFSEGSKDELLGTIQEEAERLNRFVGNLLDMTRLGSGALKPNRQWSDIEDVIGNSLSRMASRLQDHEMALTIAPGLPLLNIDYVLIEQVLVNLLDNAAKYSASGSRIAINVQREAEQVVLTIVDEGIGIPEEECEQVFDMFYRAKAGDRQAAGTGLGLSICRGIVEAHGGTVRVVSSGRQSGTCLEVRLPIEAQPPQHAEPPEEPDGE